MERFVVEEDNPQERFVVEPEIPHDTTSGGFFDKVKAYKESRINEPGLSPIQQTLRRGVWSLVPDTPGQAVTTGLATALMPGVSALAPKVAGALGFGSTTGKVMGTAGRIGAGAASGAVGSAVDHQDPTMGAATGGAVTGIMEAAMPALGKLTRSLPWMKGRITAKDASNLGNTIGEIVPELQGAKTASDLKNMGMMYDEGKGKLSQLFKDLENRIGGNQVNIPSIDANNPVTISTALEEIAKLGPRGYAGRNANIATRTASGLDARQLRDDILNELRGELSNLSPASLMEYDAARGTFRKGSAILDMLRKPGVVKEFNDTNPQLNTNSIQRYISDHRGELQQRLGQNGYEKLVETVFRGGGVGKVDELMPGSGTPFSALRGLLQGRNTGSVQALRVPLAFVLPNIGSSYVGRVPYSPTGLQQILSDIIALGESRGVMQYPYTRKARE